MHPTRLKKLEPSLPDRIRGMIDARPMEKDPDIPAVRRKRLPGTRDNATGPVVRPRSTHKQQEVVEGLSFHQTEYRVT